MVTGATTKKSSTLLRIAQRPYRIPLLALLFSVVFVHQWYNLQPVADQAVNNNKEALVLREEIAHLQRQNALLTITTEKAVALPSVPTKYESTRKMYGGKGDGSHLGGFIDFDLYGISPATWKHMVETLGVKSVLDVGCGRGISTSWFALHGVDSMCVEGSHDAITKSVFTQGPTIEHDFSRGPWWPPNTVDALWCVEFLEHVGRNFQQNYIPAFRKAAFIFASHSHWGGWHHVEVHKNEWWIPKMQSYGFIYSHELTEQLRMVAKEEKMSGARSPNGQQYNAQHIWLTMQVFINPAVASLPQHQHLFAEHGCFSARGEPNRKCGAPRNETPLPKEYLPLELTTEMDDAWTNIIKQDLEKKQS